MTVTPTSPAAAPGAVPAPAAPAVDLVTLTVDGAEVQVPKGTMIIRAAELLGVQVPRFCDHPLLEPVAACRACLVEVEGLPKPQPSCAVSVAEGMRVRTQLTSAVADAAQQGVMEFLLVNHPLDCPVCDKGGECPLQNQAMSNGRPETRFDGPKRTFAKPVAISAQVLLDRERCVSCARCTRFSEQIAGDPFIDLFERGARQQVGVAADEPFHSYFSGNTIQICPVGALTSARYRFRARPFDLVSVPTVCEHCASGCALRTDVRRSVVVRRLAGDDPQVNDEWSCDKGRFAFAYQGADRLERPMVRDGGALRVASWPEALDTAARALAAAGPRAAVLAGGRLTAEDALAYSVFARVALGTDDVDFRARPASAEEAAFLAACVAGRGVGPTYADVDAARAVLLVGLEPEEESPILFLRLRKAVRRHGLAVAAVAPYATNGLRKLGGALVPAAPGAEAAAVDALAAGDLLRARSALVLVGERAATSPGTLSAVARLAVATGARIGWVPRRAGERGALEAGLLPGLLPGGRPLADPAARAETAAAWGVDPAALPAAPGRGADALVAALLDAAARIAAGEDDARPAADALVVAGVDPADTADPAAFLAALDAAPFVLSLETRPTAVTARADVVLPVAVVTEKAGTYLDWEGRPRPFEAVFPGSLSLPDARVLAMVAQTMADLAGTGPAATGPAAGPAGAWGRGDADALRALAAALPRHLGARPDTPDLPAPAPGAPAPDVPPGRVLLAGWRRLLDAGRLQEGEPYLAATARPVVATVSPATAAAAGLVHGGAVAVTGPAGSLTLPVAVEASMVDGVVELPLASAGSAPRASLGAAPGDLVDLAPAAAPPAVAGPASAPADPSAAEEVRP